MQATTSHVDCGRGTHTGFPSIMVQLYPVMQSTVAHVKGGTQVGVPFTISQVVPVMQLTVAHVSCGVQAGFPFTILQMLSPAHLTVAHVRTGSVCRPESRVGRALVETHPTGSTQTFPARQRTLGQIPVGSASSPVRAPEMAQTDFVTVVGVGIVTVTGSLGGWTGVKDGLRVAMTRFSHSPQFKENVVVTVDAWNSTVREKGRGGSIVLVVVQGV